MSIGSFDKYADVTIPASPATKSTTPINTRGRTIRTIKIGSAWTTANIKFEGRLYDEDYAPIEDEIGNEYVVTVTGNTKAISLPADNPTKGYSHIRLVVTAAQAAARTVRVGME